MSDGLSPETPVSVKQVGERLQQQIAALGSVWLTGEVLSWNVRGANVYGQLRDLHEDAKLDFAVWRNVLRSLSGTFSPGDRVVMHASPQIWVPGGRLSLIVHAVSHVGIGEFLARIERLRQALRAEGLFDAAHKKRLPYVPQCIGLVTGRDSDAEKDVLQNARLRWPDVRFKLHYATVQGERAAGEVSAGIRALDADPEVDVIIVARGGGELQHLLPFSDEEVVRAAFHAATPLVSAIGHEADRPLLDDVADLRASTPTDAAKRVVPDVSEEREGIASDMARITGAVRQFLSQEIRHLEVVRARPALAHPESLVSLREEDIFRLHDRAHELTQHALTQRGHEVARLRATLTALSPKLTLERGYAIAQLKSGQVLTSPKDAETGEPLTLTLAHGKLQATVTGAEHPTSQEVVDPETIG